LWCWGCRMSEWGREGGRAGGSEVWVWVGAACVYGEGIFLCAFSSFSPSLLPFLPSTLLLLPPPHTDSTSWTASKSASAPASPTNRSSSLPPSPSLPSSSPSSTKPSTSPKTPPRPTPPSLPPSPPPPPPLPHRRTSKKFNDATPVPSTMPGPPSVPPSLPSSTGPRNLVALCGGSLPWPIAP
jgi:hypothetical protein